MRGIYLPLPGCPGSRCADGIAPKSWEGLFPQRRIARRVLPVFGKAVLGDAGAYVTRGRRVGNTTQVGLAGRRYCWGDRVPEDGGNTLLRKARPKEFSVYDFGAGLAKQPIPPDVIRLEANWKDRLHTRAPHGLNDN